MKAIDSDLDAFAYVLDGGKDEEPVKLVFRGSGTSVNIITDLLTWKTSGEDLCPGCSIHTGFYQVWASIEAQVLGLMTAYEKDREIVVTGHSLGGAMAASASLMLVERGYENVAGYTFGKVRRQNRAKRGCVGGC